MSNIFKEMEREGVIFAFTICYLFAFFAVFTHSAHDFSRGDCSWLLRNAALPSG